MALYSQSDMDTWLAGPHVNRAWFLELDLPSGLVRYHNGVGNVTVGGYEWAGVSDPIGGQLVNVSAVEDPRFGQAPKVDITIAVPSLSFFQSLKSAAREIEGVRADLYWTIFDPETEQAELALKKLFPGKASAPKLRRSAGVRLAQVTIESFWEAQNFPFGGKWSPAGQRSRYAGDKGLDFVGVSVTEFWK